MSSQFLFGLILISRLIKNGTLNRYLRMAMRSKEADNCGAINLSETGAHQLYLIYQPGDFFKIKWCAPPHRFINIQCNEYPHTWKNELNVGMGHSFLQITPRIILWIMYAFNPNIVTKWYIHNDRENQLPYKQICLRELCPANQRGRRVQVNKPRICPVRDTVVNQWLMPAAHKLWIQVIGGLVQERRNPTAIALEFRLSCTNHRNTVRSSYNIVVYNMILHRDRLLENTLYINF